MDRPTPPPGLSSQPPPRHAAAAAASVSPHRSGGGGATPTTAGGYSGQSPKRAPPQQGAPVGVPGLAPPLAGAAQYQQGHAAPPGQTPPQAQQQQPPEPKRETTESKVRRFYTGSDLSPPEPKPRPYLRTVPKTSEGAEQLAAVGDWTGVLRLATQPEWQAPADPAEELRRIHVQAIAFTKLNRRNDAYRVLATVQDPDAPFSLQLLRASVAPTSAGPDLMLHQLLAAVDCMPEAEVQLADRRRKAVTVELARYYQARDDAGAALEVLGKLAARYPEDMQVRQRLAALLMQSGHVGEAQKLHDAIGALPEDTPGLRDALTCTSGLLATCDGDPKGAFTHFARNNDARDCANTNNMAVSFMYNKRLPHAIKLLEQTVRVNPEGLTEIAARNLCTLYDMMSDDPGDKKDLLAAVAATYKGSDFASAYQASPA